jgi:hypothetical protein
MTRKLETYLKPAEHNLRSLCLRWRPNFPVLNVLILGRGGGGLARSRAPACPGSLAPRTTSIGVIVRLGCIVCGPDDGVV